MIVLPRMLNARSRLGRYLNRVWHRLPTENNATSLGFASVSVPFITTAVNFAHNLDSFSILEAHYVLR